MFVIKNKSRCLQKGKLVDWEGQACQLGEGGRLPGGAPWGAGPDPPISFFRKMFLIYTIFPLFRA